MRLTNVERDLLKAFPDETLQPGARLSNEQIGILNGIICRLKYGRNYPKGN